MFWGSDSCILRLFCSCLYSTIVFRIFDYALAFYIEWLGLRIDWPDRPAAGLVHLQMARAKVELHLSSHPTNGVPRQPSAG